MRVFGNLTNHITETVKPVAPVVGMGVTIVYYSDREAGTIVDVSTDGKKIKIQQDLAIRTDSNGQSESQDYRFEANPKGDVFFASLRKNGTFVLKNRSMQNGTIVRVGERDTYHDYGF